jgi:hypothetical protein
MSYMTMLAGADTLSFYNYDPEVWNQTPGFVDGFAELMRELTDFSLRLRGITFESRMSVSGILKSQARLEDGRTMSILVNSNRTPVDGFEPLAVDFFVTQPSASTACRIATKSRRCIMRRRFKSLRRR